MNSLSIIGTDGYYNHSLIDIYALLHIISGIIGYYIT